MKPLFRLLYVITIILVSAFTLVYALFIPIVWILLGDGVWWRSTEIIWEWLDNLREKF